jgi:hypothetical protein
VLIVIFNTEIGSRRYYGIYFDSLKELRSIESGPGCGVRRERGLLNEYAGGGQFIRRLK